MADTPIGIAPVEVAAPQTRSVWSERFVPVFRYLRRNRMMTGGLLVLLSLSVAIILATTFYRQENIYGEVHGVHGLVVELTGPPEVRPSWNLWGEWPLGTDLQGRDIFAGIVVGTPLSLRVGLLAALIGVGVGMVLAFVSAYTGGLLDAVVRTLVDSLIPIPGLLIVVLVATSINPGSGISVDQMAIVISVLAWPGPARVIRSQVLVMRERGFVEMARMSGTSSLGIIFKEMMPNLAPYILASFVASVSGAILASVGLEALGLGPQNEITLGRMIYLNIFYGTVLHGLWWWMLAPIATIVVLFVGLFMISAGLDELANPRLRRRV